jgi:hypothetical protein
MFKGERERLRADNGDRRRGARAGQNKAAARKKRQRGESRKRKEQKKENRDGRWRRGGEVCTVARFVERPA